MRWNNVANAIQCGIQNRGYLTLDFLAELTKKSPKKRNLEQQKTTTPP